MHRLYTTDRITLIVETPFHLDEQQKLVTQLFSKVPESKEKYENPHLQKPRFLKEGPHQGLGIQVQMTSPEQDDILRLDFVLNIKRTLELKQAFEYIIHLFKNRSEGGFYDCLQATGLIADISASGTPFRVAGGFEDDYQAMLVLMIPVTLEGIKQVDVITAYVLGYIEFLTKTGIDKRILHEIQFLNEVTFNNEASSLHMDTSATKEGTGLTDLEELMGNLNFYPMERFLVGFKILPNEHFSLESLQFILNNLRVENLQRFLMVSEVMTGECRVAAYTNTRYRKTLLDPKLKELFPRMQVVFKLPEPSPFVPSDFESVPTSQAFSYPRFIAQGPGPLQLFFSQDVVMHTPSLTTQCFVVTNVVHNSAFHSGCFQFYTFMLTLKYHQELHSMLAMVGAKATFSPSLRGLLITVKGFSDKHKEIAQTVLNFVLQYRPELSEFNSAIESLKNLLSKKESEPLDSRCGKTLFSFLNGNNYSSDEILAVADKVTFEDMQKYLELLFTGFNLQFYVHGNTTPEDAVTMSIQMAEMFDPERFGVKVRMDSKETTSQSVVPVSKIVRLRAGQTIRHHMKSKVQDNCVMLFFQASDRDLKTEALLKLLASLMEPRFFQVLRTEKHLAYTLAVSQMRLESCEGIFVYIQSPGFDADYLLEQIELFLQEFVKTLKALPEEEFRSIRDSQDGDPKKSGHRAHFCAHTLSRRAWQRQLSIRRNGHPGCTS